LFAQAGPPEHNQDEVQDSEERGNSEEAKKQGARVYWSEKNTQNHPPKSPFTGKEECPKREWASYEKLKRVFIPVMKERRV